MLHSAQDVPYSAQDAPYSAHARIYSSGDTPYSSWDGPHSARNLTYGRADKVQGRPDGTGGTTNQAWDWFGQEEGQGNQGVFQSESNWLATGGRESDAVLSEGNRRPCPPPFRARDLCHQYSLRNVSFTVPVAPRLPQRAHSGKLDLFTSTPYCEASLF